MRDLEATGARLATLAALAIVAALVIGIDQESVSVTSAQLTVNEPVDRVGEIEGPVSAPSRFGKLTSSRWSYGAKYRRESLDPVPNPHPNPEPQPLRDHPFDVAVNGAGTKVYIGLQGNEILPGHEVAVYDIAADRIVKRIQLKPAGVSGRPGSSPYRFSAHPDGRFLLVTNRFSNFVSVIDTRTDRVVSEVPTDFYCQGGTYTRDGKVLYMTNRYLDQVFVIDVEASGGSFRGKMRELNGLDDRAFFGGDGTGGIHSILRRRCGESDCHAVERGGFVAGEDPVESFVSVLSHVRPGQAMASRLARAPVSTLHGGYADAMPSFRGHPGGVVFRNPGADPDYQAIGEWINSGGEGPGIPVSNPRSKPKVCVLTTDERYLIVGNTGTQDLSIVDTRLGREVAGIYLQNVVNDVKIYHSEETGHDYLLVTTEGIGFGVGKERDPYGGECWDEENPAAQFSVWRDLETAEVLPKEEQKILGPFDAVDGTAEIKFRDIQNDLLFVDIDLLKIPENPPADALEYILLTNRYESHKGWVRYTSDTAESTYGDIKGDIAPDLMRVVGALPERMVIVEDHLFVTMQGSNQVQELLINPIAADPSDYLVPLNVYPTGIQPVGIAKGPEGTPAEGKVFVASFLGGSLTIIDPARGTTRDVTIDPSVDEIPVPSTNAERGEIFAHTAVLSSDGDTACFHCHYLDMGDGRPWGVSQVVGQEFLSEEDEVGQLIIGGTMNVPQMRNLFQTQPFFFEGAISVYEPRSMIMEHCPSDDFTLVTPQGDYTEIEAHYVLTGTADVQSGMDAATTPKASLDERRDEMFRNHSVRLFGKSFKLRDFQRFIGDWQAHEPRLLPNPYDQTSISVLRGKRVFEDPQVGCVACHTPPSFTRKDFEGNAEQSMDPMVMVTVRDGSFTLISMNRLDYINGYRRDLEPWDMGRVEKKQANFTTFPLRGNWDRPPVFLHSGIARTMHEVVCPPGHPALRRFKYEPLIGGAGERPGRKEVGFNMTYLYATPEPRVKMHLEGGARLGFDTHGGTSELTALEIDDLVNFLNSIE
jgi:YVTN family beta-propeller protein